MRKLTFMIVVFVSLASFALSFNPETMLRTKDLRPGMKGYGLTVFKGTKIEKFNVEILGVLPKEDITGDIILARLSGGPITERGAMVIAGMSGSPVYINGKLIGAVALTWIFSKEPIAGIRPIEDMLKMGPSGGFPPTPVKVRSSALRKMGINPPAGEDYITMVPLATPLMVSGLSEGALERIAPILKKAGFLIMQAPSGGKVEVKGPFTPGAALGCQLVSGDIQMTAVGTLTYIENGEFVAFGHSMLDLGEVEMPITSAYVHEVIPSYQFSTKLASPGEVRGTLLRDGAFAISGRLGRSAKMLPVSIEVEEKGKRKRTFNVEVVKHPSLTPALVGGALSSALYLVFPDSVDALAKIKLDVQLEGGRWITREDLFSSSHGVSFETSLFPEALLDLLQTNPFQSIRPERVQIKVEVERRKKEADVMSIRADKTVAQPGEKINLSVYLKPYGKEETCLPLEVEIPKEAQEGRAQIIVGAGAQIAPQMRGVKRPTNLNDLLQNIQESPKNNELFVCLVMPQSRFQVGDKLLSPLPPGMEGIISSPKSSPLYRIPYVTVKRLPTEWVLFGVRSIAITISKTKEVTPFEEAPPPGAGPEEGAGSEEGGYGGEEGYGELEGAYWGELSLASHRVSNSQLPPPIMLDAPPSQRSQPESPPSPPAPPSPPTPPAQPSRKQWVERGYEAFSKGEAHTTLVNKRGEITLAPQWRKIAVLPGSLLLSALEEGDGYLVTTLENGAIYAVNAQGVREVLRSKEVGLRLVRWQNRLYATSFPGGRIYAFDPGEGKLSLIAELPVEYIWALLPTQDRLLIATGGEAGRLYSLDKDGGTTLLYQAPDQHITSIAERGNAILLGTSPQGLVISLEGNAGRVLFSTSQTVNAILVTRDGKVYVGSYPGGKVWETSSKGVNSSIDTQEKGVFSLMEDEGFLLIGTGDRGRVYLADTSAPDKGGLICKDESSHITGFLKTSKGILALASNPPSLLLSSSSYASEGTFISSVFDGGITCRWGKVKIDADIPQTCEVSVETRSGFSHVPDESWSPWMPCGMDGKILSPPARFLQYRVRLKTSDSSQTPVLHSISISLRPQNLPPSLTLETPGWGDHLSGNLEIKWKANDPNNDALVAEIYTSQDGNNWKKEAEVPASQASYKMDTKKLEDGAWYLMVSVSDRPSNPEDEALTTKKIVKVVVDNTPPEVYLFRREMKIEGGRVKLDGIAYDKQSPITEVTFTLDGNKISYSATPLDGFFDSDNKPFSLQTPPLQPGEHILKIKVKDSAGNERTVEEKVKITG